MIFRYSFLAIVACACGLATVGAAEDAADEFKSLFDGETLEGWDGDPQFWRVEDGAIVGQTTAENPTKGNTFLIWRDGKTGDFELKLKYRIDGGNSGIQYRSEEVDKWVMKGYQADIDDSMRFTGILYEEKGRGILAQRGKKVLVKSDGSPMVVGVTTDDEEILSAIKKDGWNEYRIVAKGRHLVQEINGKVTVEVTDNDESSRKMTGLLALQLHAGPPMTIRFKDIQLKDLAEKKK